MSFVVYTRATAAGEWVEREIALDSLVVDDVVNERSTASFSIIDRTGTLSFHRGQGVKIEDGNAVVIFRGFVMEAAESRLGRGGVRTHDVECVDLHYLVDKRTVSNTWTNTTAGEIVSALLATELDGEGLSAGIIEDGPTIRAISFSYVSVADAIASLAERAGFWWRINVDATLDFASPRSLVSVLAGDAEIFAGDGSVAAGATKGGSGVGLDLDSIAYADTVEVQRRSTGFRNRQWIKGGRDRTVPQLETQSGDSLRRAYVLGFPIAEEPVVEVSRGGAPFVQETVGAAGIQTDRQWFYSFGSTALQHATTESVLGVDDVLRVTYVGLFDVITRVDDTANQSDRAVVEGGTGIVEHVIADKSTTSREAAFQLGGELLGYWTEAQVVVRFRASAEAAAGLRPGVIAAVSSAQAGLSGLEVLVTGVSHFSRGGKAEVVVSLVSGPREGSWAQWFGALSRRIDAVDGSRGAEVEVITTLAEFTRDWLLADRPNIFRECRAGTATAGSDTFPEFRAQDRVRFLSWFRYGSEVGRKQFTVQTGAATNEITTQTVLVTTDAVGLVEELGWWGGWRATSTPGTGILVDRQGYVKTKTEIEQILVAKTDTRWA